MVKYSIQPQEMAQFSSYISQKQAKQAEIDQSVATIQQNQLDIAGIDGAFKATVMSIAIANGALAPSASLDALQIGHDMSKRELTWPDIPRAEPKQHFKRKKKG